MKKLFIVFLGLMLFQVPVLGSEGKGMMVRDIKDESGLSETARNNYALVKESPYVLGAWQSFNWADLEPREGAYDFAAIDAFVDQWITGYDKRLAISVNTAPNATPEWVFDACENAGESCKVSGLTGNVYPVYWNRIYQDNYNGLIQELSDRYSTHPNLEMVVMAGFGHGITEHLIDKDKDTLGETRTQWEAAGTCAAMTTVQCDEFFASDKGHGPNVELTPHMQAIMDIRGLWRTAFPTQQIITRAHEVGKPVLSVFESTLRADSLANGYGLTNDGGNVGADSDTRSGFLALSQSVPGGWISWTGRDKRNKASPVLSQVAGGSLPSRTYYVTYTWVIAGVGESLPNNDNASLTVNANSLLKVTVPPFETEVTSANIYVGTSPSVRKLQGTAITVDGGAWTEPTGGISTGGIDPPTVNTAIGSVLDLYQHTMGIDGHAKLDPSAHVTYMFRDMDSLIQSVPGTSKYVSGDPEKYEAGLIWAFDNFWPNNYAPTVNITSPANGATFAEPATISISADANDQDGTITKVEFFQGATKLGEDVTAPYSFTWNSVAAGNFSLTAKATDNAGEVTTSAAVNVMVKVVVLPKISATASDSSASEAGSNTGKFTITRDGSTASGLTVYYKMSSGSGMATNGADYTTLGGSVTIAAGSASAKITVTPKNDTLKERSESVVLTISNSSAYSVGSPRSATVTITDND